MFAPRLRVTPAFGRVLHVPSCPVASDPMASGPVASHPMAGRRGECYSLRTVRSHSGLGKSGPWTPGRAGLCSPHHVLPWGSQPCLEHLVAQRGFLVAVWGRAPGQEAGPAAAVLGEACEGAGRRVQVERTCLESLTGSVTHAECGPGLQALSEPLQCLPGLQYPNSKLP